VLKARVRARPEAGAANEALLRLVARACGVAPSAVALRRGATARIKIVDVSGDPDAIVGRIAKV
jgi:uncharacterized protein YggU (UPF0235/DUF167 family)